jgi:hypothetical protein
MNKAMRKFRVRWSLMLLFALAHPAFAAFRPSFKLDDSSWHSTHIVLVMTTPADGAFEVVESWKGDLSVGERLAIPELRPAPDAIPISRYPKSWSDAVRGGVSELVPSVPVGSYVRSDVFPAQLFALAELGKSGSDAVRTILEMLDDPSFADESPELVKALAQAGGESVGAELNSRLRADLAFWRSKGPSLSQGWWNEDARIYAPLRERYDHTYQLVVGLEKTQYTGAPNIATQLRDLWRSLPQLNDPQGLNELAKECDKLIRHLQTN